MSLLALVAEESRKCKVRFDGSGYGSTLRRSLSRPRVLSAKTARLYLRKIEAKIRVNPMGVRL
jgi:hypothetical protein